MVSLEAQPLLHRGENPKPSAGSPRSKGTAKVAPCPQSSTLLHGVSHGVPGRGAGVCTPQGFV